MRRKKYCDSSIAECMFYWGSDKAPNIDEPQTVTIGGDKIKNGTINNKDYSYCVRVIFNSFHSTQEVYGIRIAYE